MPFDVYPNKNGVSSDNSCKYGNLKGVSSELWNDISSDCIPPTEKKMLDNMMHLAREKFSFDTMEKDTLSYLQTLGYSRNIYAEVMICVFNTMKSFLLYGTVVSPSDIAQNLQISSEPLKKELSLMIYTFFKKGVLDGKGIASLEPGKSPVLNFLYRYQGAEIQSRWNDLSERLLEKYSKHIQEEFDRFGGDEYSTQDYEQAVKVMKSFFYQDSFPTKADILGCLSFRNSVLQDKIVGVIHFLLKKYWVEKFVLVYSKTFSVEKLFKLQEYGYSKMCYVEVITMLYKIVSAYILDGVLMSQEEIYHQLNINSDDLKMLFSKMMKKVVDAGIKVYQL